MGKFFKKTNFGLNISDQAVELLQLSPRGKIKIFSRVDLEPDIIKNGLILEKKKLKDKIKEVLANAKIKNKKVILCLPESKAFIHIFNFPISFKEKKIKKVINLEAQKLISLNPEKIYWDYQIIPNLFKEQTKSVLYVAIFKNIVDDYLNILEKVGLNPIVLEIESLSLGRALLRKFNPQNSLVIVDIGARTTNFSIFNQHKKLCWFFSLSLGGNHFTEKIAEKLNISLTQAEKLKKEQGLKEKGEINVFLSKQLEKISEQLEEIVQHYPHSIEKIILTGGSAQMPGLLSYFSLKLKKKVVLGQSEIKEKTKGDGVPGSTVTGLALKGIEKESLKEINILSKGIKRKFKFKKSKLRLSWQIFAYVFFLISLGFLVIVIFTYSPKKPYLEEIVPEKIEEEETSIPLEPVEEIIIPESEPEVIESEIIEEEEEAELVVPEKKIQIQVLLEIPVLNVRQGPGTNYAIIDKIRGGETYNLLQDQDQWYEIELEPGQTGWVSADYVEKK
jgi:type IV pilus assembly protein PilM